MTPGVSGPTQLAYSSVSGGSALVGVMSENSVFSFTILIIGAKLKCRVHRDTEIFELF